MMVHFIDAMNKHFGIPKKEVHGRFVDHGITSITGRPCIDLFKFDDWLHEKHGDYETERGMSMRDLLIEEYGQAVCNFIEDNL